MHYYTTCTPLLVRCGMSLKDATYLRRARRTLNKWLINGPDWRHQFYRSRTERQIARVMHKYRHLRIKIKVDAWNATSLRVTYRGSGPEGILID